MTEPTKFTFSKPKEILREGRLGSEWHTLNELEYIKLRKAEIEERLLEADVYVRKAKLSDMPNILKLTEETYEDLESKNLVSSYDYFQSITYNYGLVLCLNKDNNRLVGCFFNYAYHANGDKICNLKRLAVSPDHQKYGFGEYLFEYNQLLAKEVYGSRIQTGLIEDSNFPSIALVLNKMGGVFDFFTNDMTDYFSCYSFVISLNMNNWNQMEISQEALVNYLNTLEETKDYLIINHNDRERTIEVCANKNFKISAALRAGKFTEHDSLVAFSNDLLNLELLN